MEHVLIAFLILHEGYSKTWYPDGGEGCYSIGYGANRCGELPRWAPLSVQGAERLLHASIKEASSVASVQYRSMTGDPITALPELHQMALVELVYNTGSIKRWPKLVQALKAGDTQGAILESKRYYRDGDTLIYMKKRTEGFIATFLSYPLRDNPREGTKDEWRRTDPAIGITKAAKC